ncbi:hypothetical protein [Pseudomonas sp. SWI44]|uniref:hypothetical protein n=1 Tax=Pseudomonas sp. SWI44 TaxID=2083053 RepID=UPI000CE5D5D1|nr:hypothetical protein [Pseudomonas sp. SWI44]AVD86179.1 hypothetical protein C4Q26_03065 [Pseudomonas sp. SWI44]
MPTDSEVFESLRSQILGDLPEKVAAIEQQFSGGTPTEPEEPTEPTGPSEPVDPIPADIQQKLDSKVDKVEGKQLTTEDFTADLKAKLDALPLEVITDPEQQPSGSATGATALVGNGTFNANSISGDPYHLLEVNNNNSGKQCVRINSYGASSYGNNVHFCRYFGTQAAPSAIGSGAFLMSTGYRGHDGSGLSQSAAAFQVVATENWTAGAHGIRFQWEVTPKGSITRKHMMELDAGSLYVNGSIGVGKAVAPWHSNYRVVELGGVSGCAIRGHVSDAELTLTSNAYYDTAYKRGMTGGASAYQMTDGSHSWLVAVSGSAGAAITFKSAMKLASDGILRLGKDTVTGRSINAAGTVNASGADYAEYMRKSDACGVIQAGQIAGVDAAGLLTDKWAEAVSFIVKSTAPAYVGGDDFDPIEIAQYDRMAFAGRVPVNVTGAQPGDYIVPTPYGNGISGYAAAAPSFEQYRAAVGRVISIAEDGRAIVIVKAA